MGCKNSALLFIAFLHHILPQELKSHLTVYVDDILFIRTESSIVELTRQAITQVGKYGICFSAKKIQLKQSEIEYLGYKVVPGGIEPLPRHIEAITALRQPITTSFKVMYDTIKEYNINKTLHFMCFVQHL